MRSGFSKSAARLRIIAIAAIAACGFALTASAADAAGLSFATDATNPVSLGTVFNVDIRVGSDIGINAAQATVQFDPTVLNVVSFDTGGSVFGFWLVGPEFSNANGTVGFVGGSTDGFSGRSLQVLHLKMKAIAAGAAKLIFNDAAVTASDGSGTNVLDSTTSLELTISGATTTVTPAPIAPIAAPAPIESVEGSAPKGSVKPIISVAKYPNPKVWYNVSEPFQAKWKLPSGVTDVAASVTNAQSTVPAQSIGKVFEKNFSALPSGVWYVHVRFKNSEGWGGTAHYRIGIDTVPPIPVNVLDHGLLRTPNPKPTITLSTTDELSGVDSYQIQVDGGATLKQKTGVYEPTEPLSPGAHVLNVSVFDRAKNFASTVVNFEILPLLKPTITYVKPDVFAGEGGLVVVGTAQPSQTVLISIKDNNYGTLYQTSIFSASDGQWAAVINQPLLAGPYYIEAAAQNADGAQSLPASAAIVVAPRPVIVRIAGFSLPYIFLLRGLLAFSALVHLIGLTLLLREIQRRKWRTAMLQKNLDFQMANLEGEIVRIMRDANVDRGTAEETLRRISESKKIFGKSIKGGGGSAGANELKAGLLEYIRGKRGVAGPAGPVGQTGQTGHAGPTGPIGQRGAKGDRGSRGEKGGDGTGADKA